MSKPTAAWRRRYPVTRLVVRLARRTQWNWAWSLMDWIENRRFQRNLRRAGFGR